MTKIGTKWARAAAATAAVAAILCGAAVATPTQAQAAPLSGRVCMFNAPNAVDIPYDGLGPYGHVGWAFHDGRHGKWTYGATENPGGKLNVPAGGDNGTWIKTGAWQSMLNDFKTRHTGAFRYVRYRCQNTPAGDAATAARAARTSRGNGYNLFRNNCLTKSIDIFHAYTPWLGDTRHLPSPYYRDKSLPPNLYFLGSLNSVRWNDYRNL
ncbi:Tat pathway signal protein [Streptomyces sp. ISL-94]|uniref:Tat pathway signal protein n=1 Tax=Streptomyces sp. ISL-94 TaxID=2819190 RepID=UPI001BEB6B89|nr:Tat pathway signal protein [Streptomyces sp. ISL-94]MBT2476856.1 Tat pathway signal protein [Streptomyces sp. ISL-94]